MRSGVEVWIEKERVETLQKILENITGTKFINFDNQTINTADIVGIWSGNTMGEFTRRKNGQWKCDSNSWHDRNVKCDCGDPMTTYRAKLIEEAVGKCGKCRDGWVSDGDRMVKCACIKNIK